MYDIFRVLEYYWLPDTILQFPNSCFWFFKNMFASWVGFRAVVPARLGCVHGHAPLCRPLCPCPRLYRTTFFACGHTPLCRPLCPLAKSYPLKSVRACDLWCWLVFRWVFAREGRGFEDFPCLKIKKKKWPLERCQWPNPNDDII
jgi:hypothetical protein